MPFPAAAAIGAGASIISQGINAYSQGRMNRKQRQWSEKMYERQRADSLADWLIMNKYNSPAAQMKRYKDAGLNPNLIYGESNTASPIRSSSVEPWRPQAPQFDLGAPLMGFVDAELKQVQTDNLKTQNDVAKQEIALKAAQVEQIIASTNKTKFDTDLAVSLRDNSLQVAEQTLRKMEAETGRTQAETSVTLNRDEREAAMNASNLREAVQRILNLKAQEAKTGDERNEIQQRIRNLQKDEQLKDLDIRLKKAGIQPGDPWYIRILGKVIEQIVMQIKGSILRPTN